MSKLLQRIFSAAILTFIVLSGEAISEVDGFFHIYYVDVGQADAAIITCDDMVLMIDGGNVEDSSLIYSMLQNALGIDHIDYMIATHPHEDHIGGLSGALKACTVDVLYTPVTEYDTKAFNSMMDKAYAQGTVILSPQSGDTFYIGSAVAEILAPLKSYDTCNDMSIVVRVIYGDTRFLFTGDIEWEAEHDIVNAGIDLSADVLKVSHHGSSSSSSYVFLREVIPAYAIVSVGRNNSYGHPDEDTLSRLRNVGAMIMRTDESGMIECISDGNSIAILSNQE